MAYSFKRSITIDHTKVPSTLSDFPVLVSGTYSYLATTGNGGDVQNANGYDIAFYSDITLSTQLKHEVDYYSATNGEVVYWVKIPSVSHTSDTVFYIAYGDSGISTSQADPTNVWDSDYMCVIHLGDGSTLSGEDSTSNNNDFTSNNTPTAITGKIKGGVATATADSHYMSRAVVLSGAPNYTISAWVRAAAAPANASPSQPLRGATTSDTVAFSWNHNNAAYRGGFHHRLSNNTYVPCSCGTLAGNTWHYIVGTWDGSNVRAYRDGSLITTTAAASAASFTGSVGIGGPGNRFTGDVDEFRMSDVARSTDWITAEYNNQNSPSTFYSISSPLAAQVKTVTGSTYSTSVKTVNGITKSSIKSLNNLTTS